LHDEVRHFNRHARLGTDPAYHRGESAFDRYHGDRRFSNPNLAPLDEAPFFGLEVHLGSLGTKGGPVTNASAQVLDIDGGPIAGLYAVGNVAAHVFGPAYPGAGATLSSGMTFAMRAGREIVAGLDASRESGIPHDDRLEAAHHV
jgi:3-oxosteroid 1-dehydrogenase